MEMGVGEVGSIVELPPQETTHVGGNDDIVVIHPNPPFNQEFLRPSKWLKTHGFAEISPTLPYEIKPEEEKPCPKIGVQFLPAPSLQELLEECPESTGHFVQNGSWGSVEGCHFRFHDISLDSRDMGASW